MRRQSAAVNEALVNKQPGMQADQGQHHIAGPPEVVGQDFLIQMKQLAGSAGHVVRPHDAVGNQAEHRENDIRIESEAGSVILPPARYGQHGRHGAQ